MPAATTLMMVSAGISAVGMIAQGQAAKNQADYKSDVQRQQAKRERQIGKINSEDFRRDQSRLMAKRRAAMGASGVDIGVGSPMLTAEDFEAETELSALRILDGANAGASRLEQQAELTGLAGRNARTGSYFKAGSSLLSGAAYSKAYGTGATPSYGGTPYSTGGGYTAILPR